jgi:ACT domain-containing protein
LEFWLDQDGLLQQVLIIGRVVATDIPETVRKLTLENINQPVTIEPPGDAPG